MTTKKISFLFFFFGAIKLILHFLTNTNYHLHRDEFLYFDQGKHLAWGYYEVPPLTPFIAKLAELLGGSVFAIRLFPALAGLVIILLACKLVKDLGGGHWAILICGFSLTLSPSLLGSNSLFQPVSFNQLFWFLIAYSVVQIIRDDKPRNYNILSLWIGLGFLTKYSVVFYLLALLLGLLLSKERKLLKSRNFLFAILAAFLITVANIFWQYSHGFPLVDHMSELRETQLVHIDWIHFLKAQLIEHKGFTIVWVFALAGFFGMEKLRPYKSLGIAFFLTLLLIGGLQGKAYYTLGAFLILFPFGSIVIEKLITSSLTKSLLLLFMFVTTLPFYPLSIPVLKIASLKNYTEYLSKNFGINYMLRWEDGNYYDLPQDIADMHGWEELAQKVAKIYHSLPAEDQRKCMIYGGSYSHAGSLNYFSKKYQLPVTYSFNGSYVFWLKEDIDFDNQILVDDRKHDQSDWFAEMTLVDSIQNPNAREKGYIYYRTKPKMDMREEWKRAVLEEWEH